MEYERCLVELDEILKYLSDEDKNNIPYEIRKAIHEKKDKKYNWNYDESKPLSQQNINRKTIAMLSYLNMEYLLNEEQKKLMEEVHKLNEQKIEKEKSEKYNQDNIIKNKKTNKIKTEEENNTMIKYKKENIFVRIKKIIKNMVK